MRLLLGGLLLVGCSSRPYYVTADTAALRARAVPWQLVATLPHDASSFVQGLVFVGDRLFESAGGEGTSKLLELDPATGEVLRTRPWPDVFAEGLAFDGAQLIQLSWQDERAMTWDPVTLEQGEVLPYDGEGWGLCFDGARLIRSDGSARLRVHEVGSFEETGQAISVTLDGRALEDLNELECVDDGVLANVWRTPFVVWIDPASGEVGGTLDFQDLVDREAAAGMESVLNGIARQPSTGHLYVTGKHWKHTYVVSTS